jgi:hypothetical protein
MDSNDNLIGKIFVETPSNEFSKLGNLLNWIKKLDELNSNLRVFNECAICQRFHEVI